MAAQTTTKLRTHAEYTVGWVCALPKEQTAATAMLDQRHSGLPKPPNDPNIYTLGSVSKHNIVIACLPKGKIGTNAAATVATWMVSTFPSIKFGLMVGIGGGIPPKVRLGDVVVSTPVGQFPGVVQWDSGKAKEGGSFERTGSLNDPPNSLLAALTKLETDHELVGSKVPEYLEEMKEKWPRLAAKYIRSDSLEDMLFKADYGHVNKSTVDCKETVGADDGDEEDICRFCDKTKMVKKKPRDMCVHYGLIASGNKVIKDAGFRDKLNKDLGGDVLCVEMEAAGLMNNFPCVVIRGICDYADSHKNKAWQEHAAAAAAAFAKELLGYIQPIEINAERPVKDILDQVLETLSKTEVNIETVKFGVLGKEDREILNWVTPFDHGPQQSDYVNRRELGTGQWLLDSEEFRTWVDTERQTLFCPGIPGAGKTILTSIVVDDLPIRFKDGKQIGIAYLYCNFKKQHEQKAEDLLASLLKQLVQSWPSLPESVRSLHKRHEKKRTRPSFDELSRTLQSVAALYSRVFIVIDALDECQESDLCRTRLLREVFNLQKECGANIFATSRFIPEITEKFKRNKSLEILASKHDVRRYVDSHLSRLPSFVEQNADLQEEVTAGIVSSVDGMFLLAQLHLDSLIGKKSPKAIRTALAKLPTGSMAYNDAYDNVMERIGGQVSDQEELAKQVLSWIIYAKRPLTTIEIRHALAIEIGEPKFDEENLPQVEDMVSVCAGLVTIDKESGIIRLVHYTTQQYFERTQTKWFPNAETDITAAHITYLSFTVFEGGPCQTDDEFEKRLQSNPLYDYAAHNWGHHARKALTLDQKVIDFLQSRKRVEAASQALIAVKRWSGQLNYSQEVPRQITGLHLAAYFGVEKAVEALLRRGFNADSKDNSGRTPLSWAAVKGHEAVVKLLLDTGKAEVNLEDNSGRTPLSWAAEKGHKAVVKLLQDRLGIELSQ